MAILEVLSRSQRLCEKRSVVILMYPSYLKDCVEPGAKITLYHGSQEKNLHELHPANDYAVRHGFAKRQSAQLTPLLFLATNALTAATYAIPETLRASVRSGPLGPRGEHRRSVMENFSSSFGSVYVKELQLPHRFARKPFIVERIVAEELDQIVVVTNRVISPSKELTTFREVFQHDLKRDMLARVLERKLRSR